MISLENKRESTNIDLYIAYTNPYGLLFSQTKWIGNYILNLIGPIKNQQYINPILQYLMDSNYSSIDLEVF